MATTPQIAAPAQIAGPLVLWHLLSLDAPTVAALWVWLIARSSHIRLPLVAPAAMATAVWMLYVVDRLLDTRRSNTEHATAVSELEARHLFHYRHRHIFLIGLAFAAAAQATFLPHLDAAAMRLYLIEGGLLLVWFVILHATRSAHRLPKEIAVGLFFSAATFIPTVALEPGLRATLLPDAVLFAAICSLNCLFIYAWEHEGRACATARLAHPTTRLAVAHLHTLVIAAMITSIATAMFGSTSARPIAVSCALAAGVLLALHHSHRLLSRNHLRVAADMALLTPILLIPFMQ